MSETISERKEVSTVEKRARWESGRRGALMVGYNGPEWDSEMVCTECGLSYVSTRYVAVEGGRIRLCPECADQRTEQEAQQ
jgi:hypothetical protein